MSFFSGGGGGGGFGQNNQSSGFGSSGFGSSNTGGGFGTGSAFGGGGTSNTGGGLFGNNNNTSSGFGSGGGSGFGSNTQNQSSSIFGGGAQNRPGGFSATTNTSAPAGNSIFGGGGNTGSSSFGSTGFGSTNTGTTGGFGSNANTGGGIFGNKSGGGFGSSTTGTGAFGGGTGGFGTPAATGTGFGSGGGTAFSGAPATCEGTGGTPFNPFTEKDSNSTTTNHYQSISFMQPYNKFSFEELRLADYQQGRRFGNASGQPGAFGSSAFAPASGGFGTQQPTSGFGSTSTPFGAPAATSAPSAFGTTQTSGGFGSGASNPLFGGSKPAGTGFGATSGASAPSLFGGAGGGTGTTSAFGGGSGTGSAFGGGNTGSSLFGNQQANKPAFGATGTTGSTFGGGGGGGFGGQQTTSAGSAFGSTTATSSPFGGGGTGTGSAFGGGGAFGAQNQPQQNKSLFGGGGGFGATNNQQQTGSSLFGGNTAGGTTTGSTSLFGQPPAQQQNTGSSLFGGAQNQPSSTGTGTGLFGNTQQQKPGGLFGSTPSATGGSAFGGFGGTQQQQTGGTGGGLFGGGQNQQAQKPSLFGGSTGTTGGGLFGGQSTANQGTSSLFGGQSQQQPQAGSSLFGGSQQQQQQPQQQQPQQQVPGSLHASLLDGNPYGSQSIFSGLPAPSAPSPGPLATPLSSSMKQKQRTPLPVHKITPNAANRLVTPPRRQGYGFSYSPSSASSTPSSVNNTSLLRSGPGSASFRGSIGGSLGRSFSKSYSTSNLRKTFDPASNSVLSPGALQVGSGRGSTSGLKRLNIDQNLRNDLFTSRPSNSPLGQLTNGDDVPQPADKLKKKVSFDSPDGTNGEVVPLESASPEPTPEELGYLRSIRPSGSLNGIDTASRAQPESTRRELAVVPENGEPALPAKSIDVCGTPVPTKDGPPGQYWSRPSVAQLKQMSRDQLKQVVDFTVGRENIGQVTFEGPVDLTTSDLDNLFGGIVNIVGRTITVYPDMATKPARGQALNVPSLLRIHNCWPRGKIGKPDSSLAHGKTLERHLEKLRKVTDTHFINYDLATGTWLFGVDHFTTYGLDYDEDDEGESLEQSTLSAGPDNGTPKAQPDHPVSFEQSATFSIDESFVGSVAGVDDDTFDFKKRKLVPGSLGSQAPASEDEEMRSEGETESFLEEGSTGSTTEQDEDVTESQQSGDSVVGSDEDQVMDMAGSFPNPHRTVEQDDTQRTGSYLETTQPAKPSFGTPPKPRLDLSGDWAEQLQRTISPRKQNRDALREIQANAFADRPLLNDEPPAQTASPGPKKGFSNSIDLMNSLFQQPLRNQSVSSPLKSSKSQPKGFEWPYSKQPKTFAGDEARMNKKDAAFHASFKPRWGPMDSIVCAKDPTAGPISGITSRWQETVSVFSEGRDIAIMQPVSSASLSNEMLDVQKKQSTIQDVDGTPLVRLSNPDLRPFSLSLAQGEERLVWQLANILFNDDIEDEISASVPPRQRSELNHRIKKERLSRFWENIIRERHSQDVERARSPEERAFQLVAAHRVPEACKYLEETKNIFLAILFSQIGRSSTARADMEQQIEVWRENTVLSEVKEPIRALYELVAGNCLLSDGEPSGALEDRTSSFTFSERFDLDWLQAFGLRLWYGIEDDEPLEVAVYQFLRDLETGEEHASPRFEYEDANGALVRPDSDPVGRESPLWVLLRTYSATTAQGESLPLVRLPEALLPESVSGDRLTNRLSFQLHHVLVNVLGHHGTIKISQPLTDRLVWDYGFELVACEEVASALFVFLHLSNPEERKRVVQETLARFSAHLPNPVSYDGFTPDPAWHHLTVDLHIPAAWIWVAKALFARDSGDAIGEVDCLIYGKHWNDAHATFCRVVGPTAVISRDYATLEQLVSGFGDNPERKVRGWSSGGGIYEDFLRLATAPRGRRDMTRLSRLVNALVGMSDHVRNVSAMDGLEERVAFKEMSRAVAGWITEDDVKSIGSSAILGLPLTGDARVRQTVELSRKYYGAIMTAGGF